VSSIALRTLQRKIEEEIPRNKAEIAITSSRAILEKYPKNIATYRLLGKAFLENPNLDLADVVFDIILRVDPDDFVSHIGKSFVAESKGELTQAVDSMERAFELQPANEMLQQEVKRLLKLKNGIDPNKVRLTRGSLIKMYLRGKLFSQAASEIRIGIHESPNRIDFKVNMAECLFNLEKPIQAVETCVSILSSLPYCWKANQIIDDVISRDEEYSGTNLSRSRLIELDPYYEHMLPTTNSILDVPDISVMFESEIPTREYQNTDWISLFEEIWQSEKTELESPAFSEDTIKNDDMFSDRQSEMNSPVTPSTNANNVHSNKAALNSKKERFKSKLRGSSNTSNHEQDIPDWILEDKLDKKDLVDPQPLPKDEAISTSSADVQAEAVDSTISEIDSQSFHKEWHSENLGAGEEIKEKSQTLDDTQRMHIASGEVHNKIQEAQKAAVNGNFQHSIQIIRNLMKEKENLKTVISSLENIIEDCPDQADFKSLLGQAYLKCGRKEEANQIFLDIRDNLS